MRRAGRRSSRELISWNPAIVVPGHGDIGGAEILAAVRDYMVDLGQARGRGAQGRQGRRRDRGLAGAENPRRASRLVGAGMDRFRHQVLFDAELTKLGPAERPGELPPRGDAVWAKKDNEQHDQGEDDVASARRRGDGRFADLETDLDLTQHFRQRGDDDRADHRAGEAATPPITSIATIRKVRSR